MGRKVHPIGFRIGGIRDWQAKWFADKSYAEPLQEDLKLRQAIQAEYAKAATSQIQIDRQANMVSVTVHTARPGVVIGRGGQRVDKLRLHLESLIGKKIQLNIQEIQQPELDAYLVARAIGDQIESRISYRRAMKQAISRTIMAGAKGIRVNCAGRLGGAEIARRQTMHEGQVPLHTLRADIDYGFAEARTTLGRIGVKVWIYKGDVLPEIEEMAEIEEAPPEVAVAEGAEAPAEAVAVEKAAVEAEVKPEEEAPVAAVAVEKAAVEAEVKPEEAPKAKAAKKPAKPAVKKKAVAKPKPAVSKKEAATTKEKKQDATTKEG
jgi:small subunit ribosomal protein S3